MAKPRGFQLPVHSVRSKSNRRCCRLRSLFFPFSRRQISPKKEPIFSPCGAFCPLPCRYKNVPSVEVRERKEQADTLGCVRVSDWSETAEGGGLVYIRGCPDARLLLTRGPRGCCSGRRLFAQPLQTQPRRNGHERHDEVAEIPIPPPRFRSRCSSPAVFRGLLVSSCREIESRFLFRFVCGGSFFRCASVFCFCFADWSRAGAPSGFRRRRLIWFCCLPVSSRRWILQIFPGLVIRFKFFPFSPLDGCCDWLQSFPSILFWFSRICVWSVFAAATRSCRKIHAFATFLLYGFLSNRSLNVRGSQSNFAVRRRGCFLELILV